jgi:phage major head subunit gpT-like protein
MATTYEILPRTVAQALQEFSDQFAGALALGDVEAWAEQLGATGSSTAIKTTYPIPVFAAGYAEFKGNDKYRTLYSRTLSMRQKKWQDGVQVLADKIKAADFMGWGQQPAAMALEAQRLPNILVASLLKANGNIDFYRDDELNVASARALFANDHPYNVFDSSVGSFDNDLSSASAIDATSVSTWKQHFRNIKGPNGKPLGLQMTHLMVPPALEEEAKEFFEQDMLIVTIKEGSANVGGVAQRNRHKGTVQLLVADELEDADIVYPMALNKPGLVPWIVQRDSSPEEIIDDESSEMYKRTGHVAIAHRLNANAAACLPHAIARVQIT